MFGQRRTSNVKLGNEGMVTNYQCHAIARRRSKTCMVWLEGRGKRLGSAIAHTIEDARAKL